MNEKKVRLGVLMDPIESIQPKKDTTLAMLLSASRRGWSISYMNQGDLRSRDGEVFARTRHLEVFDDLDDWFRLGAENDEPLSALDILLMRKDPPFDMEYIYTTYMLDRLKESGVLVVNDPQSLRDANEKFYTAWFADLCPATLITRSATDLHGFLSEQDKIVVKPLDGMGGRSIFVVTGSDANINVIFETMTEEGQRFVMAQRFIPEIKETGDKRVLLIDGEPVPYMLARIPAKGESRGNLAAGARGEALPLGDTERRLCERIGPTLRERGLIFVGVDVIGDYMTEINVTSPTGVRELDSAFDIAICDDLMDVLAARI